MSSYFLGKSILVTGSCGTVGAELVRQLLTEPEYRPSEVIGIDNSESELFFQDQSYLMMNGLRFLWPIYVISRV